MNEDEKIMERIKKAEELLINLNYIKEINDLICILRLNPSDISIRSHETNNRININDKFSSNLIKVLEKEFKRINEVSDG